MQAAVRDAVARQDQLDLIQRDALAYTPYPEERAFALAGEDEEYLNSRGAPSSHFHLPDPSANFTAAETVEGRVDHLSGTHTRISGRRGTLGFAPLVCKDQDRGQGLWGSNNKQKRGCYR